MRFFMSHHHYQHFRLEEPSGLVCASFNTVVITKVHQVTKPETGTVFGVVKERIEVKVFQYICAISSKVQVEVGGLWKLVWIINGNVY
jgi:hypothetical protein